MNACVIINLLSRQPLNLNSIAENFDVSRQAISLHIKILNECGLIAIRREGRERYCEPRFQQLKQVAGWAEQYRNLWEGRLDKIDGLLQNMNKTKNKNNGKRN